MADVRAVLTKKRKTLLTFVALTFLLLDTIHRYFTYKIQFILYIGARAHTLFYSAAVLLFSYIVRILHGNSISNMFRSGHTITGSSCVRAPEKEREREREQRSTYTPTECV